MARFSALVLLGLIVVLGNGRAVYADPQILAVVPLGGPLALTCQGGVCEAEFSAICLQPERRLPDRGTPYKVHAADLGSITLSGETTDGQIIDLPSSLLKVASRRGQSAVRLFIDKHVLERNGLRSASVRLERMIALLPEPEAGGSAPQTPEEIAKAVSGIERVGDAWAEFNADNMAVARIVVRVSNDLPTAGPVSDAESIALLHRAAIREPVLSPRALNSARNLVTLCQRRTNFKPIRACLEEKHDQLMLGLNARYWSALAPGS